MEWSNSMVLKLIEAYRERPILWDSTELYYKNRNRKEDAWKELAEIFETDSSEIKKKMQSLLASFRREKQKLMTTSGMGTNEVYNTKWFAFSSLLFLKDKNKPRQTRDTEAGIRPDDGAYEPIEDDESQHDDIDQPKTQQENNNVETNSESQQSSCEENDDRIGPTSENRNYTHKSKQKQFLSPKGIPKKQKTKEKEDPRITEAYSVLSTLKKNVSANPRDDCFVYGEHISLKLKSYDTHTRAIVQHHINNILFNADMGMYARYQPQYQQSYSATNSTSARHEDHYEYLSTTPSPATDETNSDSNQTQSDTTQDSYVPNMSHERGNFGNTLTNYFKEYDATQ